MLSAEDRLHSLEAVTDAARGRLDVDDLLVELLERVRVVVDADTAAVLLLDITGQELVARAACGIEEDVEQGVRIPVGRGFAGRIAQRREPIVLDRVASPSPWSPSRTFLRAPVWATP